MNFLLLLLLLFFTLSFISSVCLGGNGSETTGESVGSGGNFWPTVDTFCCLTSAVPRYLAGAVWSAKLV